jgi:F420H(2)-dependent quinone reductase
VTTTAATVARRRPRSAILGFVQDGPNLVTLAMNGWADPEPSWWRNLQAQPDATVDMVGETCAVRARAAQAAERSRLWARWSEINRQLDAYAAKRSSQTAVVILEPRPASP